MFFYKLYQIYFLINWRLSWYLMVHFDMGITLNYKEIIQVNDQKNWLFVQLQFATQTQSETSVSVP